MSAIFQVPPPHNEPVLNYAPNSTERTELQAALKSMKNQEVEIASTIDGKKTTSGNLLNITPPHEHNFKLGAYHRATEADVHAAIASNLNAKKEWESFAWEERAAIFLKAADLLCGPFRARMNAATMLGQSKNCYQAEIDAACEMADFFRFNVKFMTDLYQQQPISAPGIWNRVDYRPLEGFVFAVTPFNFTSIAANLAAAPALMGNTVLWKPSDTQIYSAQVIMDLFEAAGLPKGVINLVLADGPTCGKIVLDHKDFAGLHFTGSTGTFQHLWKEIGNNLSNYRSFPRIVGETGGKDFIFAHPSADAQAVAANMVRGAFEYQGQKCSAASRAYIPKSLWAEVKKSVQEQLSTITVGSPEDFTHFVNAVIDERAFDKITSYIARSKEDKKIKVIAGGNFSKEVGYFIEPTVLEVEDPQYITMCDELFGPVLSVYVYDDNKMDETIEILDRTSPYSLTGAIFAQDRYAIADLTYKLRNSAGNFYINDKPTGAVVGQQPFGGARSSGTNDKAGSILNLQRWVSPRTIKENFLTPKDYRYPFLGKD